MSGNDPSGGGPLRGHLYLAVPVQMGSASLAAHFAQEIADGSWSEGESLPGVRRLAREVGCSPGTAARSYMALREGGVLSGCPRSRFVIAVGGAVRAARWGADPGALRMGGSDDPRSTCSSGRWAMPCRCSGIQGRRQPHRLPGTRRGGRDDPAPARRGQRPVERPVARGALGGAPVELVHLWRREQGRSSRAAIRTPSPASRTSRAGGSPGASRARARACCWSG